MKNKRTSQTRPVFIILSIFYVIALYFFYSKYVPLVKPFQIILVPILFIVFVLTLISIQWGTLFFIFSFPLISNLPYFFGINEYIPHAPTALVLFLFFFLGWMVHISFSKREYSIDLPLFKPMILFSCLIVVSGIITFLRYANFYPFYSDYVYELITNAHGVTAGGAIMSMVFNSLNYLTGFAFLFIIFSTIQSKEFLKKAIVVLCSATVLSLFFGLYQHFKDIKFGNNPSSIMGELINATFKDALSFGIYIAIVIPLILGIFFAFKGFIRALSFFIIIPPLYLVFFIGSRSGVLSLIISVVLFTIFCSILIFNLIKSKSISLKKISRSSCIIFLLIGVVILSLVIIKTPITEEIARSRLLQRFTPLNSVFEGRAETLWKLAVPMIKDYPLTGVGIGGYIIEVSNYAQMKKIFIETPESAENYFLQVGSELGLLGIFLIAWIFWEIIKEMRRSLIKTPNNDNYKFILIGAIVGVLAFMVNIQFHTYIGSYEIKYTFWLLVGLIFSFSRIDNVPEKKANHYGNFTILSIVLLVLYGGVLLWNSTHSLSLKNRTEQFNLKQDFGLYQTERASDGSEFRWTKSYGGISINVEKPVIAIPLLASHPDILKNPVKVRIFLIEDLFKRKSLLDEITITKSIWNTYEFSIPEEMNNKLILLIKVSRTWNPQKTLGTPDPRNLGVAVGKIEFF